ncbi:hypothetical protein HDK90DRAFT_165256 [Phyllosticta capitalensis]|uniref:Uncharacterized protein n=1 Tax=Phyllosticta capitalensis TaxID=121624 RepID=A0ABR1Z0Z9_9PEZI
MLKFLEIHRHHHLDVCFYRVMSWMFTWLVHFTSTTISIPVFSVKAVLRALSASDFNVVVDNELRSVPDLQDLTISSLPVPPPGYANAFLEGGRVILARQATPGESAGLPTPRKGRWVYVVPKVFPIMTTDAAILGMWINGPPVAAPAPIIPHGRLLPPPGWAYARTLDEPLVLARLATMEEVVGRIHPPRGWTYLVMYLGARSIVDLGKWLNGMPALL